MLLHRREDEPHRKVGQRAEAAEANVPCLILAGQPTYLLIVARKLGFGGFNPALLGHAACSLACSPLLPAYASVSPFLVPFQHYSGH